VTAKTKLKRVGSVDGGSNCKGCYYQSNTELNVAHYCKCTKPKDQETCCAQSRIGRVRWCIFVEDKDA
jgi:hypothetical protein